MEIAPGCSQAGLPFQKNKDEAHIRCGGTDLETAQNTFSGPTAEKTGSGVVSFRTQAGCSVLECEQGRRCPASVRRIEPDLLILAPTPTSPLHRRFGTHSGMQRGTANLYFCRLRTYDTTAFAWSGVRLFTVPGCFAVSVMAFAKSLSDSFLASSETRLGILAAGLPVASAPWQAAHFAL
jgi:hypothetical protein